MTVPPSMLSSESGAGMLESAHMVNMLIFLYENGESRKMDLYNYVGRNNRLPDKLESFRRTGLVYYRGVETGRLVIGLTDLGEFVASKLKEVDTAIKTSAIPDETA